MCFQDNQTTRLLTMSTNHLVTLIEKTLTDQLKGFSETLSKEISNQLNTKETKEPHPDSDDDIPLVLMKKRKKIDTRKSIENKVPSKVPSKVSNNTLVRKSDVHAYFLSISLNEMEHWEKFLNKRRHLLNALQVIKSSPDSLRTCNGEVTGDVILALLKPTKKIRIQKASEICRKNKNFEYIGNIWKLRGEASKLSSEDIEGLKDQINFELARPF